MGQKTRILIVDDEEVVRQSYLRTLSGDAYQVKAAWSGREALRMMEEQHFDVVLLDLRMPGMDGMEVLKAIKKRWPESEVVIITGYPSLETAKEAVRQGAYHYMTKPVGPEEVVKVTVGAIVNKRWALHKDRSRDGGEGRYTYRYPWES